MFKFILTICVTLSAILSAETKVLSFAGSTRTDSLNKKLALEAASIAHELGAAASYIDLRDYPIPFFDEDLEKKGMPESALRLRQLMIESDVIIVASPEYNSSVSGVLKNALDWVSRTESGNSSRDAFKGKQFVIMGASPGKGGAMRGLQHLQTIIDAIGGQGTVVSLFSLPNAYEAFDGEGHFADTSKQDELKLILQQLIN